MSRDLHISMLDLERLRIVQGGGDKKLLQMILEEKRFQIECDDEHFRNLTAPDPYTPLATALQQIIDGRIDEHLTPRFQFNHAASLIADFLGEPLETTWLSEAKEAFWHDVDVVIQRRRDAGHILEFVWPTLDELLGRGPLLDVPLDPEFPSRTGYLTAREVERAAVAVQRVDLENSDGLNDLRWSAEALDAAEEYRGWLRAAAANRLGLFFHC
jgi:hypothetical protein